MFERRQEGVRKCVERLFGVMKSRFTILQSGKTLVQRRHESCCTCLRYTTQHDCRKLEGQLPIRRSRCTEKVWAKGISYNSVG